MTCRMWAFGCLTIGSSELYVVSTNRRGVVIEEVVGC